MLKLRSIAKIKNIITMALISILLIGGVTSTLRDSTGSNTNDYVENETQNNNIAIDPSEHRGYQYLQKQDNAESLVFAYNKLAYGFESFQKRISVSTPFHLINSDEMLTVFYCYIFDNPQVYWVDLSSVAFGKIANKVVFIETTYKLDKGDVEASQEEIKAIRDDIIKKTKGLSDKEKALFVHDYIIANTDPCFGYESEHANTLYGALIEGRANCLGFSHAFTYLMRAAGVVCFGVYGEANQEEHAWNIALIDGKYRNVDVTWDAAEPFEYKYFSLSDQEISKTHKKIQCAYDYPACE